MVGDRDVLNRHVSLIGEGGHDAVCSVIEQRCLSVVAWVHVKHLEVNAVVENKFVGGYVVPRIEVSVRISSAAEESEFERVASLLTVIKIGQF